MDKPHSPQVGPYPVMVEEGRTYRWCSCGLSADQPWCDDSHKSSRHRLRADRVHRPDHGRVLHVRMQGLGQQALLLRQLHRPRGPGIGFVAGTFRVVHGGSQLLCRRHGPHDLTRTTASMLCDGRSIRICGRSAAAVAIPVPVNVALAAHDSGRYIRSMY